MVLHNIRSVHNAGSIFRTADGAGASEIVLSGYTPGPEDHHGRVRRDFTKVSLGSETMLPHRRITALSPLIAELRREGYMIVAVEISDRAIPLFEWSPAPKQKLAVLFGNEVEGISKDILDQTDVVLKIPMRGGKESLNVSVAAGIALYHLLK